MKPYIFSGLVNLSVYAASGGGWMATFAAISAQVAAFMLWQHIEDHR